MNWKVTVHTVYISGGKLVAYDSYTKTVEDSDGSDIANAVNECIGSALSEGDTIASVSVVPAVMVF